MTAGSFCDLRASSKLPQIGDATAWASVRSAFRSWEYPGVVRKSTAAMAKIERAIVTSSGETGSRVERLFGSPIRIFRQFRLTSGNPSEADRTEFGSDLVKGDRLAVACEVGETFNEWCESTLLVELVDEER